LELDFSQIYTGVLLENDNYKTWFNGQYSVEQLRDLLGTDLHSYMHADFFNPFDQQNDEYKKIQPLLTVNSVTERWHPKAPIYLSSAKNDVFVPVACAEAAVRKLRKAGANISLHQYPGDHVSVGFLYYLRSIIHFFI
jgi:acetyl esterase/lipase